MARKCTDFPGLRGRRPPAIDRLTERRKNSENDQMVSPRPAELLAQLPPELGHQLRFGHTLPQNETEEIPPLASGLAPLDAFWDGGLRPGHCCELFGPLSGGRTSCAIAFLAGATRAGRGTAWIECAEAFDPASALAAGVDLERLLWVRAPSLRTALRAGERLLDSRALALVVLDLTPPRAAKRSDASGRPSHAFSNASWLRLRRAAAASRTALLLLAEMPQMGTFASTVVEARSVRPQFEGSPSSSWFAGTHVRLELERDSLRSREATAELPLRLDPELSPSFVFQPPPTPFDSEVPPRACRLSVDPRSARHRRVSNFS